MDAWMTGSAWDYLIPVLVTIGVWWGSTGLILYIDRRPEKTYRLSLLVLAVAATTATTGLWLIRDLDTPTGAYLGFLCAITVWGWHELAFLTGLITGPSRGPCPPGERGFKRFARATATILYHELALTLTLGLIVWITWGGDNQVGTLTFLILWIMRLSAKLNIFLGVPNMSEEFLPDHLGYLKSYFRRRPMNGLFPISVTGGTLGVAWLVHWAVLPDATPFAIVEGCLLAALLALAVLEHWFLVLPLPDAALWRWAMPAETEPGDASTDRAR